MYTFQQTIHADMSKKGPQGIHVTVAQNTRCGMIQGPAQKQPQTSNAGANPRRANRLIYIVNIVCLILHHIQVGTQR